MSTVGVRVMVQGGKLLPGHSAPHTGEQMTVPATPLPVQLPAYHLGGQADDGPRRRAEWSS